MTKAEAKELDLEPPHPAAAQAIRNTERERIAHALIETAFRCDCEHECDGCVALMSAAIFIYRGKL